MISEKPYNVAFLRSILCGTDPSCKQTNQLNVSTMARQCPSAMDCKSSESSSRKKDKSDIACHACTKTGHKAFSCPN